MKTKLDRGSLVELVSEVRENLKKNLVSEGGFSRLRQIMLGQVPSIESLGILTAENPGGETETPQENNQSNAKLKARLREKNYSFIPVSGDYGMKEKSFVVPHMSKEDAIALGDEFSQEAVIWGEKVQDLFGENFFRFEFLEGGKVMDVKNTSLGGTEAQEKKEFYSEKSGRKFVIPFFDETQDEGLSRESFMSDEIPDTAEAEMLAESISNRAAFLSDTARAPKSKWAHRGMLRKEIRSLERIVLYHKNRK